MHSIQSRADAQFAESLRLELDDVQVLEVSLEDLSIIADELFHRESCDREVKRYLENGEYVCQGQRVLKASTKYVAAYDNTAAGSVEHTTDLIRNNFDPTVSIQGGSKRLWSEPLLWDETSTAVSIPKGCQTTAATTALALGQIS